MRLPATNDLRWSATTATQVRGRSTGLGRRSLWPLLLLALACGSDDARKDGVSAAHRDDHGPSTEAEASTPNGGRLLRSGAFALEFEIFEQGGPAELRVRARLDDQPVDPPTLNVEVALERLGGRVDRIEFRPRGDHLVSSRPIDEPHSFEVSLEAELGGERHTWNFEQFEGRTRIDPEMAASLGVETEPAGPATLVEELVVYGRVRANAERTREVRARFEGTLDSVLARIGDRVVKGTPLFVVESNESLRHYTVSSPLTGTVTQRDANPGEQTGGRLLMTITDTDSVWVNLAVFPVDRSSVTVGQSVSIWPALGGMAVDGVISRIGTDVDPHDQSVLATVELSEPGPQLLAGTFVTGRIQVGEHTVPLAVRREGIQTFRDWRVVYAQIGDEYEVRMLELGRSAGKWVEVLSGLEPGTRYVTRNSHLIKADIEKSGASHDH